MKKLLQAILGALVEPASERLDSATLRDIGVESWLGDAPERLEAMRQRHWLRRENRT